MYRLLRWVLGGLFIHAGVVKLLEPQTFAVLIAAFGIVPEHLLMAVSIGLPALEVAAGIGLLFDIEGSLAVIAGLLGLFIGILCYGIFMGLDVDCGCFGPEDPEAEAFHGIKSSLYRDLAMVAGVLFIYGWRRCRAIAPVGIRQLLKKIFEKKGGWKMLRGKSILKLTIIIFLVSGMAGIQPAFAADKFEQELGKETEAVKLVREVQRGGYDLVTTAEFKQWIDGGKDMVIVDTMPYTDSYKKQHVPGAVQFLFPIPDMNEWDMKETDGKTKEEFVKLLGDDKNKPIVIYCGFVKCTRSHNGAAWAVKLGYNNVYRYPGGIFAWKGADYTVAKAE
ncbi:MAG: MauE/DoxX family redox-associated membrane protein [Desulfobacterales bacterium]